MISDEIRYQILSAFVHTPTAEQYQAIDVFIRFVTSRNERDVMVLRGSAGTGKTTLAGAFVQALVYLKQRIVLLAPTGRAAKVFSVNANHPAYTIHRRIYRQQVVGELSGFNLNHNLYNDTLFIVDEASMIANEGLGETAFGTGRLLDDLVQFVYGGTNCRMLVIGDKAQLPPIGEDESPALVSDILAGYGLDVYEADLNEVLRQSASSGILYNATIIRQMITHDDITQLPLIRLRCFADIHIVPGNELIETMSSSYSKVGLDETVVITRSNKRANIYNRGIRNMILDKEDELCHGDMLMIVKNNYHYASQQLPFIANGDRATVQRVRNIRQLYGFSFADVSLMFPDYDRYELTATVLLDSLLTDAPSLTREQQTSLYDAVLLDYQDKPTKHERIKALKADSYYNSLQIKYAYAITCHKAQGGQWAHVYIDQGYMSDDMLSPDYIHWLYTAFTRATEQLYLVNWPKSQLSEEDKTDE